MDFEICRNNKSDDSSKKRANYSKSLYERTSSMPGAYPSEQGSLFEQHQEVIQANNQETKVRSEEKGGLDQIERINNQDARSILQEGFTVAFEVMKQTCEQLGLPDDVYSSFKRSLKKNFSSVLKAIEKMDKKTLFCATLLSLGALAGAETSFPPQVKNCPELFGAPGCLQIGDCPTHSTLTVHEVGNLTKIADYIKDDFNDLFGDMAISSAKNGNYCSPSHIEFFLNSTDPDVNSDYSSSYLNPSVLPEDSFFSNLISDLRAAVSPKLAHQVLDIPDQIDRDYRWLSRGMDEGVAYQVSPSGPKPDLTQNSNYTDPYVTGRFLATALTPQEFTTLRQQLQNGSITDGDVQKVVDKWPKFLNDTIKAQNDKNSYSNWEPMVIAIGVFITIAVIGFCCANRVEKLNRERQAQENNPEAKREHMIREFARIDPLLRWTGFRYIQRLFAKQPRTEDDNIPLQSLNS